MTTPPPAAPVPAGAPASDGKTLGIVGVILAIVLPLIGLIVSIIARSQSKRAGVSNGAATAGIVISIILIIGGIILAIALAVGGFALFGGIAQVCSELGPGVWDVDGVTYTCS
jgi:heme/copper-type cytochrome/quinol oxidase subunit 2